METPLVTVLYSRHRDLYRVPSIDKPCWLSVALYQGLRRSYARSWSEIVPGDTVTLPATDPMVVDFHAHEV